MQRKIKHRPMYGHMNNTEGDKKLFLYGSTAYLSKQLRKHGFMYGALMLSPNHPTRWMDKGWTLEDPAKIEAALQWIEKRNVKIAELPSDHNDSRADTTLFAEMRAADQAFYEARFIEDVDYDALHARLAEAKAKIAARK